MFHPRCGISINSSLLWYYGYRVKFILSLLILFFLFPFQVLALAPPTQTSPADGATVTSPTLEWQASSGPLYSTDPYKVQLADNPDFTSPKTPYYTSNTSYSPTTLSNNTWYWKVNVRGSDGNWSGWGSVWSFILISSTPTPTPTDSPTPTPTPTQTSPTIIISGAPASIAVTQSFPINIQVTNFSPNTKYFLKGAFKKSDSSNYFGQTQVDGTWVKNNETYSKQYSITTDGSGNWTGTIPVQGDNSDAGFTGTGDYLFKIGYYKDETNPSISWSSETTINLEGPSLTTTPTSTPTLTNTPTTTKTSTPTKKPTPKIKQAEITIPPDLLGTSTAQLSTPSSNIDSTNSPVKTSIFSFKNILLASGGAILLLAGTLFYTFIAKNKL